MKICFYPGCSYASSAGYKESTEAVLHKLGIEAVEIPDWNCCGATVMFGENTLRATALAARHFALVQTLGFDHLVTGCNACYATLRKAAKLLEKDSALFEKTREVLAAVNLTLDHIPRIRHLVEILDEAMPEAQKDTYKELAVGAYYGCQLTRPHQDLDTGTNPMILDRFLERIGFTAIDHSAKTQCCGASHGVVYSKECRTLSRRITGEMAAKGARAVTTLCPLCQFNLDQSQGGKDALPVTYFTQLAGLSLGIPPARLGMDKLLVSAEKVISRS